MVFRRQHVNKPFPPAASDGTPLVRSYYAKLKRAEDDIMAELAKKYRDRAKERRDGDETPAGVQQDFPNQAEDSNVTASAYRAVAPDLKS